MAPNKKHEIAYLFDFIERSPCEMNLNGSHYQGMDAVIFLQRKYKFFRGNIRSAEDFIRLAATKSTTSKEYHMLICKNREPIKIKDWLRKELEIYRLKRRF